MSTTESVKHFWLEFIEMYKENPCLWAKNCDDYRNESKRNLAYGILMEKLWEIDERADLDTVKKKTDWLQSSYRRELNKVLRATGEAIPYASNWCYFDHLTFLSTEHSKENADIIKNSMNPVEKANGPETSRSCAAETDEKAAKPKIDNAQCENGIDKGEKRRKISATTSTERDEVVKDDCETFTEHIKVRLRNLQNPLQKFTAMKLISDIMFLADTGQLEMTTEVIKRPLPEDRGQTK